MIDTEPEYISRLRAHLNWAGFCTNPEAMRIGLSVGAVIALEVDFETSSLTEGQWIAELVPYVIEVLKNKLFAQTSIVLQAEEVHEAIGLLTSDLSPREYRE